MNTKGSYSKKTAGFMAAAVLLSGAAGCSSATPVDGNIPGAPNMGQNDIVTQDGLSEAADSPLPEETPAVTKPPLPTAAPEPIILDILTHIQLEAGVSVIAASDFFTDYKGQKVIFESSLTEEELMTAGSVYEFSLTYLGQPVVVTIEIIDTTPPEISGVSALSVDAGGNISYKKNIEVSDNSKDEIDLVVDSSAVDINVPGTYPIYYTAADTSGNQATAETTVTVNAVIPPEEADTIALAQAIIAQQVTGDMTQWDMAYALWLWCRSNIRYTSTSKHYDYVWQGAYEGFKKKSGDCYIFFAAYSQLLTCCGIENMQVSRINGNSNHYWNLVNVGNGWYHCDASPRRTGDPYKCFMQTDAQVKAYTDSYPEHPNYYTFDESLYPERGTEIVFGDAPPAPEPPPETEQEEPQA